MKKFILIFLLALLPLQASWGVVSTYVVQAHEICPPTCSEAQEVQAEGSDKHNSKHLTVHHEDSFCGLHALGIATTYPPRDISFSSSIALHAYEPQLICQLFIETPERPKWTASA